MRKLLFTLTLLITAAATVVAAPVSLERARAEAMKALSQGRLNAPAKGGAAAGPAQLKLAKQAVGTKGKAADATLYYVFNNGNDGGMVVIAGDDQVRPILAYTDKGGYDATETNPAVRWWFEAIEAAMTSVINNGGQASSRNRAAEEPNKAVKPLIQTQWGQDEPYNLLCPYDQEHGAQSLTGCVATAIAQVLYYWRYPEHGTDTVSYTSYTHGFAINENLEDYTFDYDKMTTTYSENSSEEARQAVAELMYACGVATEMDYCAYASGSSPYPQMLIDYLGIDQSCTQAYRKNFTTAEWEGIIRKELDEGRPVLYGGASVNGAHQFICDGYDETGLYHINWGWSGEYDGYFDLATLNPYDLVGYNFSSDQDIIYGIKPLGYEGETAYNNSIYYEALNSMTSRSVPLGENVDYGITRLICQGHDFKGYIGSALYDAEGNLTDMKLDEEFELPSNYYYSNYNLTYTLPQGLEDGTYTLRPISGTSQDEWQPMKGAEGMGTVTTLVLTVENDTATLANGEAPELALSLGGDVEVKGGSVYTGYTAEVSIPIKNDGAYFNGSVYVKNIKHNIINFNDNVIVDAGKTATLLASLPIENDTTAQEYVVYFEDLNVEPDTIGTFVLTPQKPAEGAPQITGKGITLDKNTFTTDENIVAHVTLGNSGGFYEGYPVAFVHVYGYTWTLTGDAVLLNKGEEKTVGVNIPTSYILDWHKVEEMSGTITPGYYDPATGQNVELEGEVAFTVTKDGEAPTVDLKLEGGATVEGGKAYTGQEATVNFTLVNNGDDFNGFVGICYPATGDSLTAQRTIIAAGESKPVQMTITVQDEPGEQLYEVYYEDVLGGTHSAGTFTITAEQATGGSPVIVMDSLKVLTPDVEKDGMLSFQANLSNSGGMYEGVIKYNIMLKGLNGGGTGGMWGEDTVSINGGETYVKTYEYDLSLLIERLNIETAEGEIWTYYVDPETEEYVLIDDSGRFNVNLSTGISTVEAEGEDAPVYTISGLRVGNAADLKSLPKGIYITGGKKIVVK